MDNTRYNMITRNAPGHSMFVAKYSVSGAVITAPQHAYCSYAGSITEALIIAQSRMNLGCSARIEREN